MQHKRVMLASDLYAQNRYIIDEDMHKNNWSLDNGHRSSSAEGISLKDNWSLDNGHRSSSAGGISLKDNWSLDNGHRSSSAAGISLKNDGDCAARARRDK
jgi:hypothetical protein